MEKSGNKTRQCCEINCKSSASHSIYYSDKYEDYSDFCKDHLSEFLPVDKPVKVSPIMDDGYN